METGKNFGLGADFQDNTGFSGVSRCFAPNDACL